MIRQHDAAALVWRKSSHSAANGNCVEVALPAAGVAVRDSKDVTGPALSFSDDAWTAFVTAVAADALGARA